MRSDLRPSSKPGSRVEVILDGQPVSLPPLRCSLAAIRSYVERMALERQRIICAILVDGQAVDPDELVHWAEPFTRVEARSMDLAQVPLQVLDTARHQIVQARDLVAAAVTSVLINNSRQAREHWWNLTRDLKKPLLTLSLMPSHISAPANGSASLMQLRKWQLQQLAAILKEVDETCWSADTMPLSNALEGRVLSWLDGLRATLDLWYETLSTCHPAGSGNGEACSS